MFNLIYFILGIYFLILFTTIIKECYLKIRSTHSKEKQHLLLKFFSKFKSSNSEKHEIFVLRRNKKELSEENFILNHVVDSKEKRYLAFQNSKYKCEECGTITNLDVYDIKFSSTDSDENLKVLCKNCSKEYHAKMDLHYD